MILFPKNLIHIHFPILDSTNTWAKKHFSKLQLNDLTLITTDEQRLGRGQNNKKWFSPPKQNLYATLVFKIPQSLTSPGTLIQLLALTASNTLEKTGVASVIKWPNDLFIAKNKIAGILGEILSSPSQRAIALGIGINVNMTKHSLHMIDQPATSLLIESKKKWDISALARSLSQEYMKNLHLYFKQGFSPFLPALKKLNYYKNKMVLLQDQVHTWEGLCTGLCPLGGIQIQIKGGDIKTFYSGKISLQTQPSHIILNL